MPALFRVAQLAYLMLPAYAANMAPPFLRFWHGWNPPISERWLGGHTIAGHVTVNHVGYALGVRETPW